MKRELLTHYGERLLDALASYAPRVVICLLGLFIGWRLVGRVAGLLQRAGSSWDPTLLPFLQTVASWLLRGALLAGVASGLGLPLASLMAVVGTAGLAIGLALQGSLSNFAGGIMLLIFRPYKVGDLIEAQGNIGVVREIQIFTTTLVNADKKTIIIPNGPMFGGTIINYNVEGIRRIDVTIGISYGSDLDEARRVLMEMMATHPLVLEEPAPSVEVLDLADSSVNLAVRPFAKSSDYWRVYFDTQELGKKALDRASIEIPFPQRDVRVRYPEPRGSRERRQGELPVARPLGAPPAPGGPEPT